MNICKYIALLIIVTGVTLLTHTAALSPLHHFYYGCSLDHLHVRRFENVPVLHKASLEGDCDKIRQRIGLFEDDKNKKDISGWTPLHAAVLGKKIKAVELLLSLGVENDQPADLGVTPLSIAVKLEWTPGVRYLLANGADPDTPKHSKCVYQECDNWYCKTDTLPPHACHKTDTQGLHEVIAHRFTPLTCAAMAGNEELCTMLLNAGANINGDIYNEFFCCDQYVGSSVGHEIQTPLQIAAEYNRTNIVTLLLKKRADPAIENREGKTALSYACSSECIALLSKK